MTIFNKLLVKWCNMTGIWGHFEYTAGLCKTVHSGGIKCFFSETLNEVVESRGFIWFIKFRYRILGTGWGWVGVGVGVFNPLLHFDREYGSLGCTICACV